MTKFLDRRIDTETLKAQVNLLALAEQYVQLRRVASTNGGEWCGPCPFCRTGHDRFHVWPEPGRYWCRVCARQGDVIQFVRDLNPNLAFPDACGELQHAAGVVDTTPGAPAARPANRQAAALLTDRPSRTTRLVEHCEARLWSEDGAGAVKWLRARGLHDDTIQAARLGWSAGAAVDGLWAAMGIMSPWTVAGAITAINVRRWPPAAKPKYQAVAGSHQVLFLADALGEDSLPAF